MTLEEEVQEMIDRIMEGDESISVVDIIELIERKNSR